MKTLTWLTWPALCVSLLLGTAMAADPPPAAGQTGAGEQEEAQNDTPIDGEAWQTLKRMADTLAQARSFSVTIQANYDVVQDNGEKIEFGERRVVTLHRPNTLRVETQESDGKRTLVAFDGQAITVFNPLENVYGQIEQTGSVDEAVRHLVQDLNVRLPLALLLVSTLPAELEQRLQALDYVERNTLTPVPTDHLAGQTESVDFQVWIGAGAGDQPLPYRVSITYKDDEGEPQYRADLTNWVLNPDVSAAQLAFRPPDGAERIPFLVRVPRAPADHKPATGAGNQGTAGTSGSTEGAPK